MIFASRAAAMRRDPRIQECGARVRKNENHNESIRKCNSVLIRLSAAF